MLRSDPRAGAPGPGRRLLSAALLGSAAALAVLARPSPAAAYCRTSVCPDVGTASVCNPPLPTDCGIPLFWPTPCVGYSIQEDASPQISLRDTELIFEQAFSAWTQADCGGGARPRIDVSYAGPVACGKHEYNQKKGNANVFVFRDTVWPYEGNRNTLALTTVTYNLDTGEIYDADMEINSANQTFSFGDDPVTFDLLSIATHETGHFLGISHSGVQDATMFPDYKAQSITLRDLSEDDRAAICAVYPPGEPVKSCDPTPRHGFSSLCAADQPARPDEDSGAVGGASCAMTGLDVGRGGHVGRVWPALAALLLLGTARTARAARGRRRLRRGSERVP